MNIHIYIQSTLYGLNCTGYPIPPHPLSMLHRLPLLFLLIPFPFSPLLFLLFLLFTSYLPPIPPHPLSILHTLPLLFLLIPFTFTPFLSLPFLLLTPLPSFPSSFPVSFPSCCSRGGAQRALYVKKSRNEVSEVLGGN